MLLYNKYKFLLVLCYLSGLPLPDCIPCSAADFFFGLGFTSMSPCCCKNKQQKRLKKNEKIFCIFEKPQRNRLITLKRVNLANICTPLLSTNWHCLLQILTFLNDLIANMYLNLLFSLISTNEG